MQTRHYQERYTFRALERKTVYRFANHSAVDTKTLTATDMATEHLAHYCEGEVASSLTGAAGKERIKSIFPLGRMGTPADIARVVAFLVSEEGCGLQDKPSKPRVGQDWAVGNRPITSFVVVCRWEFDHRS